MIRRPILPDHSCQKSRIWLLSSLFAIAGVENVVAERSLQHSIRSFHQNQSRPATRAATIHASLRNSPRRLTPISTSTSTATKCRPYVKQHAKLLSYTTPFRTTENHERDAELDKENELVESTPEISEDVTDASTAAETSSSGYVPWYLEHKFDVERSTQHTAGGQEPPDIPEHSPELLEPVVKHVLETLGLSHLKILDLREMTDPPPALGANLLMVMATARSERHLHASADKLCRWLRTEYKLTPFADGLLGRNEMKIAVRRRVRRAKMMSAVGAKTSDGEGDIADGIRSEWICVNVGRVAGGVLPEVQEANANREVVGFGTTSDSSTIVVQMMTEDKREEIDMEGLWEGALRRQQRSKAEIARGIVDEAVDDEVADSSASVTMDHQTGITTFNPYGHNSSQPTA